MKKYNVKLLLLGLITGMVNGIFGSGGGIIIVPALAYLGLDEHKAHATAISIILPLTILSTIIYFLNHTIPFGTGLLVMVGGLIGSYIGAKILNKIPVKWLKKIFGSVIIYTAIRMIWK